MTRSQSITDADIRAIFRILGECRELGDDPVVWRQHFFGETAKLINADLLAGGELAGCLQGPVSTPGTAVWGEEHGFNLAALQVAWDWHLVDPYKSLIWKEVHQTLLRQSDPKVTTANHQLLSPAEWDRSSDYQEVMRPLGAEVVIYSHYKIPSEADVFDGVGCFRVKGSRNFDDHEIELFQLIHQRITQLIGGPLARFDEPLPSKLSQRARNVLACILEGDTDKEVSKRLSISPHTVNHYTKQIFSHFGVKSRAELLARWIRRGWSGKAVWNSEDYQSNVFIPKACSVDFKNLMKQSTDGFVAMNPFDRFPQERGDA